MNETLGFLKSELTMSLFKYLGKNVYAVFHGWYVIPNSSLNDVNDKGGLINMTEQLPETQAGFSTI